MIEILQKDGQVVKAQTTDELSNANLDFYVIQFIDYTKSDLGWAERNFGIDFSIMHHFEDIEISSHFLENEHQAAFHFSIPFYTDEKKLTEQPIFFIMSSYGLFVFASSELDEFFNKTYANKIKTLLDVSDMNTIFKTQFEFISDYYADITENLAKKIKSLANRVLIKKEFTDEEMDIITTFNFSNLLIKESLMETTRVFKIYRKSKWEERIGIKAWVENELNDLNVVSDYIQFNFDRLDDLRENVSNKVDLEQNHIFKVLTITTVCISLPTLIAGIYGMNFEKMPELKTTYGYPVIMIAMIVSAILPLLYFKRKKWL
jgi:magnesium transporter